MELKDLLQREKRIKDQVEARSADPAAALQTCLLLFDKSLPFLSRALRVVLFENETPYEVCELAPDCSWATLQAPDFLPPEQFALWFPHFKELDYVDGVDATWAVEKFQQMAQILRRYPNLFLILPWPEPRLDLGPSVVREEGSPWKAIQKLNSLLLAEADLQTRLIACENLVQAVGYNQVYDPRWHLSVQMPWSSNFQLTLADWIFQNLQFRAKGSKKILAVRVSGLLWPQDETREAIDLSVNDLETRAHLHFQAYLLQLKNRGVRLVAIDDLPESEWSFDQIPGMLIRHRDFAFSAQGHTPVASMLQQACEVLGCTLDQVVYLDHDDELVDAIHEAVPDLECLCLEVDPCLRVQQLQQKPYFWTMPTATTPPPIEFIHHPWSDDEL